MLSNPHRVNRDSVPGPGELEILSLRRLMLQFTVQVCTGPSFWILAGQLSRNCASVDLEKPYRGHVNATIRGDPVRTPLHLIQPQSFRFFAIWNPMDVLSTIARDPRLHSACISLRNRSFLDLQCPNLIHPPSSRGFSWQRSSQHKHSAPAVYR